MSFTSFVRSTTTVLRLILHFPYRRLLDGVPFLPCDVLSRTPRTKRDKKNVGLWALIDPELSSCPSPMWPASAAWDEEVRWALSGETKAKAKATREQAVKGAEEAAREVAEQERDATIAAARALRQRSTTKKGAQATAGSYQVRIARPEHRLRARRFTSRPRSRTRRRPTNAARGRAPVRYSDTG
jgi:hypothetical protein